MVRSPKRKGGSDENAFSSRSGCAAHIGDRPVRWHDRADLPNSLRFWQFGSADDGGLRSILVVLCPEHLQPTTMPAYGNIS